LEAQQTKAALLIAAKLQRRGNMEALLLALIIVRNAYRRQEPIVPELSLDFTIDERQDGIHG
jgi:hypothetical protein